MMSLNLVKYKYGWNYCIHSSCGVFVFLAYNADKNKQISKAEGNYKDAEMYKKQEQEFGKIAVKVVVGFFILLEVVLVVSFISLFF